MDTTHGVNDCCKERYVHVTQNTKAFNKLRALTVTMFKKTSVASGWRHVFL